MSIGLFVGFHAFEPDGEPPTRLLLLADGDIGWAGLDATLDAEAAERVIAAFDKQGNDLPIDYHHATLRVEDTTRDKAPAAGWIKHLTYVPGEGLYADPVEWTDKADQEIRNREYKYHSPVIRNDSETGDILELHSVALTNRPRTRDQVELLQAAECVAESLNKEATDMPNPKKRKGSEQVKLESAEEHADEIPAVDETQGLMAKLVTVLQEKGGTLADDAPLAEVLRVALELLGAGAAEKDDSEDSDSEETTTEEAELKMKAAKYDEMNDRLVTIEGERQAARVDAMIEEQIQAGKLLPDDTVLVEASRELATSNPKQFTKMFDAMAPLYEPGRTVGPVERGNAAGASRKKAIHAAEVEWDLNSGGIPQRSCGKQAWVDQDLREKDLSTLTQVERGNLS